MENDELRAMVLAFAAQKARECYDAVRSTTLATGYIEDDIDAGGVAWHIRCTYNREHEAIRVSGHPHRDESAEQVGVTPFGVMFGMRPDEDAFDYQLPVAWLPSGVEAA